MEGKYDHKNIEKNGPPSLLLRQVYEEQGKATAGAQIYALR